MKINRNNYELFFMDYLDGVLSDLEIRMLEDFLLSNPDLRAELEGTEKVSLSPGNIVFEQKELLLKPDLSLPVTESNFEDFCIAGTEGDLNEQQRAGFNDYTKKHPGSERQLLFFRRLRLSPDENIVFPGKEKLTKSVFFFPGEVLYPFLSVAAAVAFMIILFTHNRDSYKKMVGYTADMPTSVFSPPLSDTAVIIREAAAVKASEPEIQQASIIPFSTPKEKKKSPAVKASDTLKKKTEDEKNRDLLPPQRLNPSFEIKLPSLADNEISVPAIERGKITYASLSLKPSSPEYLSLSEYARKQLAEKVIDVQELKNTRLSAWQIADAGISGINKLTGGEMKLEKRINEEGGITAYSFDSRILSFSTTRGAGK